MAHLLSEEFERQATMETEFFGGFYGVTKIIKAISKSGAQACHPATFLRTLPPMEAEIDCKLQSNSR